MLADLILASYAPTAVRPPAPWCADLAAILAGPDLHAVFQPIVDFADARIVGYEGLIRGPSDSALHSPLNLFEAAEQCQQLLALERACRQVTLRRFATSQRHRGPTVARLRLEGVLQGLLVGGRIVLRSPGPSHRHQQVGPLRSLTRHPPDNRRLFTSAGAIRSSRHSSFGSESSSRMM